MDVSEDLRGAKVLHVVHRLGSGVEAVVLDYARALPDLEHHVVFSPDESCHDPRWTQSPELSSSVVASSRLPDFYRAVRERSRRLGPDLVHAHSSVAGGVARSAGLGTPVVHTPHCYAFLREDVGAAARAGFRLAERVLASRTSAVAACSPHEAELAARMMAPERVHYVANVASVTRPATSPRRDPGTLSIVTSGRVAAQKGVHDYVALAAGLRRAGRPARLTWIGAGDDAMTRSLREAGVEVTGWLDRADAVRVMAGGDLYVHAALWEAAPLTVLEAAELDLPVLARDTTPLRALGVGPLWSSTEDLLDRVARFVDGTDREAYAATTRHLRATHTREAQAAALAASYATALGVGAPARPTVVPRRLLRNLLDQRTAPVGGEGETP